ncbi:MAG TPA: DUF5615 family PIN-like protein [Tepidisphaeraceae bacterium]|nr:DUF5615 family PIN-like protein [Tepidisphaeraceae bacterium]
MKVLLDENLPHELRPLLMPMHDVFTVSYLGWNGIENGKLLSLAAANGFDAIITTDRGMEYEQNTSALPCSVIVLLARSNRADDLRPLIPQVLALLSTLSPRSFAKVGSQP